MVHHGVRRVKTEDRPPGLGLSVETMKQQVELRGETGGGIFLVWPVLGAGPTWSRPGPVTP